eukprot:CAMPEP_0173435370 /NCGR_PEP_ID=MMETSP1357-20121228/14945_1 /TAXON_ID=77926 /ORGANISM="Hemiselmis rufescens, Strain PCC563" /LENGTH=113 /DNA_ID=CAMNT_0014400345 /DNA_START=37 /DNA_END=375 /DNA_ORIENTATION=+
MATRRGIKLLGLDQPTASDGRLQVYVAVAIVEPSVAPTHVALVLHSTTPGGVARSCSVKKLLTASEMSVGLECPMEDAGLHAVQAWVCASDGKEVGDVLFACEPRTCQVTPSA